MSKLNDRYKYNGTDEIFTLVNVDTVLREKPEYHLASPDKSAFVSDEILEQHFTKLAQANQQLSQDQ